MCAEVDADAQPRPAVITVMGHVDHGKVCPSAVCLYVPSFTSSSQLAIIQSACCYSAVRQLCDVQTSLLDALRKTSVAAGEAGGITQVSLLTVAVHRFGYFPFTLLVRQPMMYF